MKTILKFLIIASVITGFACSSDDEGNNNKPLPDAEPIVIKSEFNNKMQNSSHFAFDLLKATDKHETGENIVISPLSVDMCLGMAWNGAGGDTKTEMQSALRNDGYTPEDINEYAKTLREALLAVDPSTRIAIANSIWYRAGLAVKKPFIDINKLNYNAEVRNVDFAAPQTLDQINNWCADNTNNRIPNILEEIDPYAMLYLINAVYFKGIWVSQFDKNKTVDGTFNSEKGTQQVKMMKQENPFPYTEDLNTRYLEMPYGNKAFSMVVMLPQSGKNVDDVINNLNPDSWNKAMEHLSEHTINIIMPRFKIEAKYEMEKLILPEMGMKKAFIAEQADFSNIAPITLYISHVTHKTFIEVNEEGTEAAAVTASGVFTNSAPMITSFHVDQPFVFAIREKSTGVILFIGKIGVIK